MNISIPTAELKSALTSMLVGAVGAEKQLGQSELTQVEALVEELYPLVVSETQALISASNPAIPQAYLSILEGCVAAAIAKQSLAALSEQRAILAGALQSGIQILAVVLKATVAA